MYLTNYFFSIYDEWLLKNYFFSMYDGWLLKVLVLSVVSSLFGLCILASLLTHNGKSLIYAKDKERYSVYEISLLLILISIFIFQFFFPLFFNALHLLNGFISVMSNFSENAILKFLIEISEFKNNFLGQYLILFCLVPITFLYYIDNYMLENKLGLGELIKLIIILVLGYSSCYLTYFLLSTHFLLTLVISIADGLLYLGVLYYMLK